MTKRLRKITKIDLPISMILKIIFTDECINVSKWHSLYVNIFFPSIANLKCTPSDRKGSPKGTCIPVTWQISTVFFWWLSLPATHFTSIYRITVLHIIHFIPRVKDIPTITHCSHYTESSFVYGGLQPRWPLVLGSLQLPHAFYTSMYLEIITVLYYNNHDGVFHACALKSVSKSLCFNKVK